MKRVMSIVTLVVLFVLALPLTSVLAQEESDCVAHFSFQESTWSFEDCTLAEVAAIVAAQQPEQPVTEATNVVTSTTELDETSSEVNITFEGIPQSVTPVKTAGIENEQECSLPAGCNVLGDPGVLGADNYEEAEANPSAVWTGGANHYILENTTGSLLLPGWGYGTMFATSAHIEGGGFVFDFPACGVNCMWGIVIRGDIDGVHIPLELSVFGAAGAAIVTRYPVPEQAGGFFSEDYYVAQAVNGLNSDNCYAGGCDQFYGAIIDYNDGSLTVLYTQDAVSWDVVYSNVD